MTNMPSTACLLSYLYINFNTTINPYHLHHLHIISTISSSKIFTSSPYHHHAHAVIRSRAGSAPDLQLRHGSARGTTPPPVPHLPTSRPHPALSTPTTLPFPTSPYPLHPHPTLRPRAYSFPTPRPLCVGCGDDIGGKTLRITYYDRSPPPPLPPP